jgi:hypothetical protein
MEKRPLTVADVVERAFPATLVRAEHDLNLTDELLEPKIDRPEKRCRIGAALCTSCERRTRTKRQVLGGFNLSSL